MNEPTHTYKACRPMLTSIGDHPAKDDTIAVVRLFGATTVASIRAGYQENGH